MVYGEKTMPVGAGVRIAQLLLLPCLKGKAAPICRTGRFGSTGKRYLGKQSSVMKEVN